MAHTWFAFGLSSKTGCDIVCPFIMVISVEDFLIILSEFAMGTHKI
jgi:hypothetical protein